MNRSWTGAMFRLLITAALPVHVLAYKVLIIPIPARSHIFGMASMAVDLVNRGHKVTFFVGENFRLDFPELRDRPEISVVRYKGTTDHDVDEESYIHAAMESGGDFWHQFSNLKAMYVSLCIYSVSQKNFTPHRFFESFSQRLRTLN